MMTSPRFRSSPSSLLPTPRNPKPNTCCLRLASLVLSLLLCHSFMFVTRRSAYLNKMKRPQPATSIRRILLDNMSMLHVLLLVLVLSFAPSNGFFVPSHHPSARLPIMKHPAAMQQRTMMMMMMIKYDDLMEKLPSKAVIEAVESTQLQGKPVIASDVATAAGVSVATARKDLTALAALSQGDIAVDATEGELLYKFPSNLSAVLANNSAKYKALQTWQTKVWPGLFWFLRVSFGVTLLVSLAAIFSTIVFLQSSSSSDNDDRRNNNNNNNYNGGGMPSFGGSYMFGPSPFDFFYWNRPYGYYATTAASDPRKRNNKPPEEMGFLPSIFSYVFGDGNPNEGLEERRLALVANLIRNNKGAVTAEQLAPFCDDAPSPTEFAEKTYVDESFVLPIATALNGEAQVTEEGDIVYVFPELQLSAASSSSSSSSSSALFSKQSKKTLAIQKEALLLQQAGLPADATAGEIKRLLTYNGIDTRGALERPDLLDVLAQVLPPPSASTKALLEELEATSQTDLLQEREYKFSVASNLNKFLAAGLGVLNLGGALWLGNLLGQYSAVYKNMQLPGYMGAVQQLYPILLAYAILFNAIPAARNVWTQRQNAAITKRNQTRQEWKKVLRQTLSQAASRDTRLGRKLRAAARMGSRVKQLGSQDSDILFDTSKSLEENKQKKVQKDMEDFDKLLSSDDNNTFQ